MPAITCTSKDEPLCLDGSDHDWEEMEHSLEPHGFYAVPGRYWRCRNCLWIHTITYPGMHGYRKTIPITCRIGWPESATLCVACNKKPRTGKSALCAKCEEKSNAA